MMRNGTALAVLLVVACGESPKASADGPTTKLPRAPVTAAKSTPNASIDIPRSALPPRVGSHPEPRGAVDWTKPEEAMREFLAAVWYRDSERLLACFSRKGPWHWVNTSSIPPDRGPAYKFSDLASSMGPEDNWAMAIFGDGEPDIRDLIEQTHNARWTEDEPLKFSAWDLKKHVWVRWRKEGKRYVVDEMAVP